MKILRLSENPFWKDTPLVNQPQCVKLQVILSIYPCYAMNVSILIFTLSMPEIDDFSVDLTDLRLVDLRKKILCTQAP